VASVDITVTATQSDWPQTLPQDVIPMLNFDPGVLPDPNAPPTDGSYFSMQVTPDQLIYVPLVEGPSGGLAIGFEQPATGSHTGSPVGTEQPGLDSPWVFFSNTGMHYTSNGGIVGNTDGTLKFNTATEGDGRWLVTWNGISFDLGGNPSAFPDDLGFATILCTPAPCADQSTYTLDYTGHVPVTAPNFAGVPYGLHLEGSVEFRDSVLQTSDGTLGSVTRSNVSDVMDDPDVDSQCVGGCFDYTITGVTDSRVFLVLPLAGGVPNNPVWRVQEDDGTWRSFDTSAGDSVKSAALSAGATVCPPPSDPAYGELTAGDQCIQLGISDNGLNDLDSALGAIRDPSGLGGGGTAGGGGSFVDTRTSDTSGCSIATRPVSANQRGDWWLVAGLLGLLGWMRKRIRTRAQ
jgi:hypothetical protein